MYETEPYIQRPDDFHQCFEYVTHDTRCTQTAIQGEYFCPDHRIGPTPIFIYPDGGFRVPPLTDRDSIVRVASQIAQRVADKSLDQKRAGKILYACQIANQALEGKLRDQKLALQQAKHQAETTQTAAPATNTTACHPEAKPKDLSISTSTETPALATNITDCHPEAKPKDLSISPATEPQSTPTTQTTRHSEPNGVPGQLAGWGEQAQNLSIPTPTELSNQTGRTDFYCNHPARRF